MQIKSVGERCKNVY